MNDHRNRILGRVLAVEETRSVCGAQRQIATIIDFEDQETSPLNDGTNPNSDQTDSVQDSGTVQDTGAFSDSGTVEDTGVLLDCISSGTNRDVCLAPAD